MIARSRFRTHADVVMRVLACHDEALARHSWAVAVLTRRVACNLEWEDADIHDAVAAALLHDVGKLAIPVEVLRKSGPLQPDEWALIRQHPEDGARLLGDPGGGGRVVEAILHHHERVDGTGYPHRLAGEEIPPISRLISVCDAYCAMREPRPYAAARSPDDATAELWRGAGSQFDPESLSAFAPALSHEASWFRGRGEASRA